MLHHVFGRKAHLEQPPVSASVPDGVRLYAIGDIHGRVDLLYRLHALIDQDFAQSGGTSVHVIYLGDYIDRGTDSAAVLERLARGHSDFVNVGFVRGNHEEMLLRFLKDHSVGPSWLHLGALETLAKIEERYRDAIEKGDELFVRAVETAPRSYPLLTDALRKKGEQWKKDYFSTPEIEVLIQERKDYDDIIAGAMRDIDGLAPGVDDDPIARLAQLGTN